MYLSLPCIPNTTSFLVPVVFVPAVSALHASQCCTLSGLLPAQCLLQASDVRPVSSQGLAGTRAVSVVLDDNPNMWAAHSHSVLHAQPFHFFHAVRQAAAPGGSRRSSDAAAQHDMLAVASNIMLQVDSRHVQAVQQAASADQPLLVAEGHPMPAWDATLIMFQMRMQARMVVFCTARLRVNCCRTK